MHEVKDYLISDDVIEDDVVRKKAGVWKTGESNDLDEFVENSKRM